ncbi:TMEM175 family protein [Naasia aerilata]|uniref:DUF1211 domain-containing membrane protein n=1 Tax=Naasia aerilata TaxID=1162966 RepID=A0ABN6XN77_9MICO|nr:TMEM175 family protein [Naasia aerilata]BDZ46421.1 DUF1211 domain-containing membrane protein [Naasia aerilata]
MATTRGLERLVFFTDAITAIAITLLILPLVEVVPDIAAEGGSIGVLFDGYFGQILGFLISFAVIARLWFAHHQLFEHVGAYSGRLVFLTVLWAFTIVLLPLPTALTAQLNPSPGLVAFYIGTMAASSLVLTAMSVLIRRTPDIQAADNPITPRSFAASYWVSAGFVLALILGTAIPALNYWALFVLFVTPTIGALIRRRRERG